MARWGKLAGLVMRFSIRDLLWLVFAAGLVVALLVQRYQLTSLASHRGERLERLVTFLGERGYLVVWDDQTEDCRTDPTMPPALNIRFRWEDNSGVYTFPRP